MNSIPKPSRRPPENVLDNYLCTNGSADVGPEQPRNLLRLALMVLLLATTAAAVVYAPAGFAEEAPGAIESVVAPFVNAVDSLGSYVAPQSSPSRESAARAAAAARTRALTAFISDRWELDEGYAAHTVQVAQTAAEEQDVDPLLVLAVIARESRFIYTGNHYDYSVDGGRRVNPMVAHGPMQVAGRWHRELMPVDAAGHIRATTFNENIGVGTRILAELLRSEGGNETRALQRYNGNLRDNRARFATHVLAFRHELQAAVAQASV
jgi:hypothetical protein